MQLSVRAVMPGRVSVWRCIGGAGLAAAVRAGTCGTGPVGAVLAALWLVVSTVRSGHRRWVNAAELAGCLLVAVSVTVVVDDLTRQVWMLFPDQL
jgi:hypothetical protein